MDYAIINGLAFSEEKTFKKLNIGVNDGRIVYIGPDNPNAKQSIDAANKILSPGFIDTHTHYDYAPFVSSDFTEKIYQGVTTIITGACGFSAAPVSIEYADILFEYLGFMRSGYTSSYQFESFVEYLDIVDKHPLPVNISFYAGHGTIRIACMGMNSKNPTGIQMQKMKKLLDESLRGGACGLSCGLIYAPGVFSQKKELLEMGEVLQSYKRPFAFHMRGESGHLIESVQEVIDIALDLKVPCQIHHLKAIGKSNWGKTIEASRMIDEAISKGANITVDQYPYVSGSTTLRAILPPEIQSGTLSDLMLKLKDTSEIKTIKNSIKSNKGKQNLYVECGPENIIILNAPYTPKWINKSLEEIAEQIGGDGIDAAIRVIIENHGIDKAACIFGSETDIENVLKLPYTMIGSDSNPVFGTGFSHPRTYGTFNRILGRYVRDKRVISMEDALWKMTFLPAKHFNLIAKGLLKVGYDADIVVFNPDTIKDNADFENPRALSEGIEMMMVNGKIILKEGKISKEKPGKTIRIK